MVLLLALSLALVLLAPWFPDEPPLPFSLDAVRPVAVVVGDASEVGGPADFEAGEASRRVVEGVAARLRARGLPVRSGPRPDSLIVGPGWTRGQPIGSEDAPREGGGAGRAVTLSVGFGASPNRWASGTETRFGGEGDAGWRLAAQVQRHLVGGLRDVLGYDGYDRGAVEERGAERPGGAPWALSGTEPWVAAYPLHATNPRERALLEWPETLDLISTALANAILDYLDPSLPTPPRDERWGWRDGSPWKPVAPRVVTGAERETMVALTFDGGASSVPTPAILKALREAGVRATMFMTAEFVEKNPELVVQMARDGHQFGNHSATHPRMTGLPRSAIVSELDRVESAVRALTGKTTRPWFRPPYGAYDDQLVRVVAEQGYYTVLWSADSADWRGDLSSSVVAWRLLTYSSPGAILVQHLGSPQSAEVLPRVLSQLKERGVRFGTLSEVLGPLD